jgi:hypothetical protein
MAFRSDMALIKGLDREPSIIESGKPTNVMLVLHEVNRPMRDLLFRKVDGRDSQLKDFEKRSLYQTSCFSSIGQVISWSGRKWSTDAPMRKFKRGRINEH